MNTKKNKKVELTEPIPKQAQWILTVGDQGQRVRHASIITNKPKLCYAGGESSKDRSRKKQRHTTNKS
jgi:hypothetical protein